ncbi:MAG TPA: phosphatase PAP2 family protein [Armatimonadota bacterium]
MLRFAAVLLCLVPSAARADSGERSAARFFSDTGNLLYLAAGVGLPLLEDGRSGGNHAARTADSVITSVLVSELLKTITHEKRPNGGNHQSFPSGHATAAFAVAAMQSHYHPGQAPFWYLGAALIGWSRVRLKDHYWHDVVAGAALGYATSWLELRQPRGFVLFPLIHRDGAVGLQFSRAF